MLALRVGSGVGVMEHVGGEVSCFALLLGGGGFE